MDSRLERDQVGAALDEQVLAEAVAAVHLEREPAEVAQALLANAHQGPPLPAEFARGWCDAAAPGELGLGRRRSGRGPVVEEGLGRVLGHVELWLGEVVVASPAQSGE